MGEWFVVFYNAPGNPVFLPEDDSGLCIPQLFSRIDHAKEAARKHPFTAQGFNWIAMSTAGETFHQD